MHHFHIAAGLLVLSAMASYLNHRFVRLPATIGMMVISLIASIGLVMLSHTNALKPGEVASFVKALDFSDLLLHGMLGFLLFAGALHINLGDLRGDKLTVAVLATVGVLIATLITGSLFWIIAHLLGFKIPYIYGLLFGALISPTDSVAITGILRTVGVQKSLAIKIAGESLFNDGIAVVLFITLTGIASGATVLNPEGISLLIFRELLGGILVGLTLGWITYHLIRSVDAYQVEILLTLALVACTYSLAEIIGVSAPIAVVVAGLLIGNHGRSFAMTKNSRTSLDNFWELMDEFLNAILFVLIGLEIITLDVSGLHLLLGCLTIFAVLIGRYFSVLLPIRFLENWRTFSPGTIPILTWAGLRGGISIALALSLPSSSERGLILSSTYVIVIFSVLVQGLTIGKLIQTTLPASPSRITGKEQPSLNKI